MDFLLFYRISNLFVGTLLLVLGVLQLIGLFNGNVSMTTFKAIVLGIYSCLFGTTIVLAEIAHIGTFVSDYCSFLSNLFGRGMFYVFAGLMILEQRPVYMYVISLAVVAIGLIYMVLFCFSSNRPATVKKSTTATTRHQQSRATSHA